MTFSINPTQNKTQAMFQQMAVAQNGTGTTAVIAGGSSTGATSSAVVAGAAATSSANTGTSGTLATGTGTIDGTGACQCSCLCGAAAFPNAAVQGVGAFGGIPGKLPRPSSIMSEFNFNSKILGAMPLNALMT
jgi:regulator of RNase E activity RraA